MVVMERRAEASINCFKNLGPIWVANFLLPSDELGEGVPLQVKGCQMHLFVLFGVLSDKKFVAFVQPLRRLLVPIIFRKR